MINPLRDADPPLSTVLLHRCCCSIFGSSNDDDNVDVDDDNDNRVKCITNPLIDWVKLETSTLEV